MTTRPIEPRNVDVIRAWIEQYLENAHHGLVARVQSYDAAKQVADLVPVVKHAVAQADGSTAYEDLPVLPSVPVLWPRAGKWFVAGCLSPGDFVRVGILDQAFEHWRAGDGSNQYPGDLSRNDLSNAVCEPTNIYPRGMALRHAPSSPSLVIGSDDDAGLRVSLNADKSLTVTQGSTIVFTIDAASVVHLGGAAGDFIALATAVNDRLNRLQTAFDAHVHATAGTGPPSIPTPNPASGIPVGPLSSVAASKTKAT